MARSKIDLNPQILDLVLYAGDGASFRLTIVDINGSPVVLTGTMKAQIRAERHAPDPALALFNVDLTDAADGIVVIELDGTDTEALVVSDEEFKGVWDLQWTPTGDEPVTILQGKVECDLDVTH